jgi:regulator of protease activity HflC (stomatin/prohibitin superfamily)
MKRVLFNLVLFVAACLSMTSCREKVDAGNVGILVSQYGSEKGVQDVLLISGSTWYNPMTEDVYQFPVFVQHKEYEEFSVNDIDGMEFKVSPTINYAVKAEKVPSVFRKYRKGLPELEDGIIKTTVKEAYRLTINNYKADGLMGNRTKFENEVSKYLFTELEKEGFIVEQITSGLKPPATIIEAINAKNKAVQDAMRIDNEVKSTEAEAKKKVAKAEGDAQALKIQADAEAYANKARQSSLTNLLVQQQFIEKWNGVLPVYGQVPTVMKSIQ